VSLLEGLSVAELAGTLAKRLEAMTPTHESIVGPPDVTGAEQELLATVADYSDDEVDAMLRGLMDANREQR
jgi:hypothetical protein